MSRQEQAKITHRTRFQIYIHDIVQETNQWRNVSKAAHIVNTAHKDSFDKTKRLDLRYRSTEAVK